MSFGKGVSTKADALRHQLKEDLVGVRMHLHELSHRGDSASIELEEVYTAEFLDCLRLGTLTLEDVSALAKTLGLASSECLDTLLFAGVLSVLKEAQRIADGCSTRGQLH